MSRGHGVAFMLPMVYAGLVLAAAAANDGGGRGPTPLTAREAQLTPRTDDRSIAEVRLAWSEPPGDGTALFSRDALVALGFDVSMDPAVEEAALFYRRQLSRRAFVAFEIDGPAYQAVLADRARTEIRIDGAMVEREFEGSRMVPVAVHRDVDDLVRRFPDARTHLITAAVVGIRRVDRTGQPPIVSGMLISADPGRLQVPVALSANLPVRRPDSASREPFTISVVYGRQWAPRVVDVSRGDASR